MIIVGLALGVYAYDNAFAAPLASLPLFVQKYQGPGFDGTLAFTVTDLTFPLPLIFQMMYVLIMTFG